MSTNAFPSARRSTFIDRRQGTRRWLAALALLAAAEVHAASPSNAEAELALARKPALYVVVDPARGAIEIKIRGHAFVSLPVAGWSFLAYVPGSGAEHPEVTLPATLRVTGDPLSAVRRVARVESLRPYDDDAKDANVPSPPPPPERAVAFEAPLESGWVLSVGPELPPTRGLAGWAARLADGWASLRGRPPARPPLLALALDADAAGRLHHVLRPGTAILVLSPSRRPPESELRPLGAIGLIESVGQDLWNWMPGS